MSTLFMVNLIDQTRQYVWSVNTELREWGAQVRRSEPGNIFLYICACRATKSYEREMDVIHFLGCGGTSTLVIRSTATLPVGNVTINH
jgi:hypothetical protein